MITVCQFKEGEPRVAKGSPHDEPCGWLGEGERSSIYLRTAEVKADAEMATCKHPAHVRVWLAPSAAQRAHKKALQFDYNVATM
jgi:hypothetical protein